MTDRYKSHASTRAADECGKWYIVDVVVREKILVEVSNDEDEYDAEEIALDASCLFQQTEKDFEVQVFTEPAPETPERLDHEMRYARRVIPRWDGDQGTGGPQSMKEQA